MIPLYSGLGSTRSRLKIRRTLPLLSSNTTTTTAPGNILVNLRRSSRSSRSSDIRFTDVSLADLGDAVSTERTEATNGYPLGTAVFRKRETTLMMP